VEYSKLAKNEKDPVLKADGTVYTKCGNKLLKGTQLGDTEKVPPNSIKKKASKRADFSWTF
jgi:hypothetical protein